MSNVEMPPEPQDPHPVLIKQQAQRVQGYLIRWQSGRIFAALMLLVGLALAATTAKQIGGLVLVWAGISLIFAVIDLSVYNRIDKKFEDQHKIKAKDWLASHPKI